MFLVYSLTASLIIDTVNFKGALVLHHDNEAGSWKKCRDRQDQRVQTSSGPHHRLRQFLVL